MVVFGSGLAVGNAPGPGLAEVFGNLLEEGVVMGMGTGGEFTESDSGVANVGAASDVGIEEFSQEGSVAKTLLRGKEGMFRSAFDGTSVFVHGSDSFGTVGSGMEFLAVEGSEGVVQPWVCSTRSR